MLTERQLLTGTVKWYNHKKGFGFVAPDSGTDDIFVHRRALPQDSPRPLKIGDRIAFRVVEQQRGPSAAAVQWLDEALHAAPAEPAANGHGFADLGLTAELLRAVGEAGYVRPTPIQSQAIPDVLAGRDLLGCAQTGTGKTAAFALPILQRLGGARHSNGNGRQDGRGHAIRVLVLSPTRELAIQIDESFRTYGRYGGMKTAVIYGGVGQQPQVQALKRGVDILTATPGRLLDLIGQGYVKLNEVEVFVLDEADRMLDMGFIHDVRRVIKLLPRERQTLLFSATMPKAIVDLANSMLRNPVSVSVTPDQPAVEAIQQHVFFVAKTKKQDLLTHILRQDDVTRALIFTRTKHGANKVVKLLSRAGILAEPIHGNKSQTARQRSLENFRAGRTLALVATDVMARGIDVDDISHVIQFDLPNEPEAYVHRIGRTGRAGAGGTALAFCAEDERPLLRDIEKLIRKPVPVIHDHPYQG